MKILVDEPLISYVLPAVYAGFSGSKHDTNIRSTFDTFDHIEPDVYIGDPNLLTEAVIKNLEERPHVRVCFLEKNKANGSEHPNYKKIIDRLGNVPIWVNDIGSADIINYSKSEFNQMYKSDIVSIQDIPIKQIESLNIPDQYIFRIFSSEVINHSKFCGYVNPAIRKHIYKSSRLSLSAGDNIYNSIVCDCFPTSIDSVLEDLNSDTSTELRILQEEVLSSRTNFHVLSSILEYLNLDKESKIIKDKLKELI